MNQPLGIYSGLLCEVKESIDFLKNENQSKDLFELIYKLGLRGLNMAGIDNGEQKICLRLGYQPKIHPTKK